MAAMFYFFMAATWRKTVHGHVCVCVCVFQNYFENIPCPVFNDNCHLKCARVLDRLNHQVTSIGGLLNSVVATGRKDVPRLLNFMFGQRLDEYNLKFVIAIVVETRYVIVGY